MVSRTVLGETTVFPSKPHNGLREPHWHNNGLENRGFAGCSPVVCGKRYFPETVLGTTLECVVKPVTSVRKGPLGEEAECAAACASAHFACLLVRRTERVAARRLL